VKPIKHLDKKYSILNCQGLLNLLAGLGAGFDIVSGGELDRVLKAGADPSKIVFSGVGKQVRLNHFFKIIMLQIQTLFNFQRVLIPTNYLLKQLPNR
jgi:hypothetical protein